MSAKCLSCGLVPVLSSFLICLWEISPCRDKIKEVEIEEISSLGSLTRVPAKTGDTCPRLTYLAFLSQAAGMVLWFHFFFRRILELQDTVDRQTPKPWLKSKLQSQV